jgi:hypothetical protein
MLNAEMDMAVTRYSILQEARGFAVHAFLRRGSRLLGALPVGPVHRVVRAAHRCPGITVAQANVILVLYPRFHGPASACDHYCVTYGSFEDGVRRSGHYQGQLRTQALQCILLHAPAFFVQEPLPDLVRSIMRAMASRIDGASGMLVGSGVPLSFSWLRIVCGMHY